MDKQPLADFVADEMEKAFRATLRVAELEAIADAALPVRGWYGLPLIYRAEHAALCDALDAYDALNNE